MCGPRWSWDDADTLGLGWLMTILQHFFPSSSLFVTLQLWSRTWITERCGFVQGMRRAEWGRGEAASEQRAPEHWGLSAERRHKAGSLWECFGVTLTPNLLPAHSHCRAGAVAAAHGHVTFVTAALLNSLTYRVCYLLC